MQDAHFSLLATHLPQSGLFGHTTRLGSRSTTPMYVWPGMSICSSQREHASSSKKQCTCLDVDVDAALAGASKIAVVETGE